MSKGKNSPASTITDDYISHLATIADESRESGWIDTDYSGQLGVDVYQTPSAIVIRAAIAGVRADDIDITVENDMVTIKGRRQMDDDVPAGEYLYQECYWGGFSRTIILPVEVQAGKVKATMKNGILRVVLPKKNETPAAPVQVIDEDE